MIAIVSSIAFLHSLFRSPAIAGRFARSYCKKRRQVARLCRCSSAALVIALCFSPSTVRADDQASTPHDDSPAIKTAKFLAGAGVALGMHETGHLVFDVIFGANPRLKSVKFGPFPFFAVTHDAGLSPRREFTISSAGFWVQHATDEWLLVRRPRLRDEHAPFLKGMLAFNVLTSVGYSMAAFARVGPYERDTRGMAASIGVKEPVVGVLVLSPALLDAFRYWQPQSKWAVWTSRAVKVGGVLLVAKSNRN
jgi:hypothetical protein